MPRPLALLALIAFSMPDTVSAQANPAAAKQEFLGQFQTSMSKFIALAEAIPADKYAWSPGQGVMTVAHVYAHVAHYNYAYPAENMGVALPPGIGLDTLERVRDKAQVVAMLKSSAAFVTKSMAAKSDADLAATTELYGRKVPQWSVLLQLVSHMNEHLGQSIAYARMNGVVPPWSR